MLTHVATSTFNHHSNGSKAEGLATERAPIPKSRAKSMLHTSLSQFILMVSGIIAGTLIIAVFWASLETVLPKLKGCFAHVG